MVICTKEEPLAANGFLHAVDDASGKIINSAFANSHLNRYSFLFKAETGHGRIAALLEAVTQQVNPAAAWVAAWNDHSGDLYTPVRAKLVASQRRKEGYNIYEEQGTLDRPQLSLGMRPRLTVAMKSAGAFRDKAGEPLDFFRVFSRQFLVLGEVPPPETFTGGNARATMMALAERGRLTPSKSFLTWLEGQQLSLLYRGEDISENGYFVLISVSPKELDLEELLEKRVADEVTTKAWGMELRGAP